MKRATLVPHARCARNSTHADSHGMQGVRPARLSAAGVSASGRTGCRGSEPLPLRTL